MAADAISVGESGRDSAAAAPGRDSAYDVDAIVAGLYTDGIIACKGAFSREWTAQMAEDIWTAFEEAADARAAPSGGGPTGTTSRSTLSSCVGSSTS